MNRENFMNESEQRFKDDNKDLIETYLKYTEDQAKKENQEYGAEQAEEDPNAI